MNQPPIAVLVYEKIGAALSFQFDASNSYDPDGYIENYRWDLGDGSVRFGQVVTHTFPGPGDYVVKLTVTDNRGARDVSKQNIRIETREVFEAQVKNAIDYWDPLTRNFALQCVNPVNSGPYNIGQICDIWDISMESWVYVNDPPGNAFEPTPASVTISAGLRGDCDDFAVLLAALITAIGGWTRFIVATKQNAAHAYAEVYAGKWGENQYITNYICARYNISSVWYWEEDDGSAWLNLDWQEHHPGGRYYDGNRIFVIYPWADGKFHPLEIGRCKKAQFAEWGVTWRKQ